MSQVSLFGPCRVVLSVDSVVVDKRSRLVSSGGRPRCLTGVIRRFRLNSFTYGPSPKESVFLGSTSLLGVSSIGGFVRVGCVCLGLDGKGVG